MFSIGITSHENLPLAAVLEKTFKQARKKYLVKDIVCLWNRDIQDYILSLNKDPAFTYTKKVFSQMGRPSKRVKVPPVFILDSLLCSKEMAAESRDKGVRIEYVTLCEGDICLKTETPGLLQGDDHTIGKDFLFLAIQKVIQESRLMIAQEIQSPCPLQTISKGFPLNHAQVGARDGENPTCTGKLTALSLALWFPENQKGIKRY